MLNVKSNNGNVTVEMEGEALKICAEFVFGIRGVLESVIGSAGEEVAYEMYRIMLEATNDGEPLAWDNIKKHAGNK